MFEPDRQGLLGKIDRPEHRMEEEKKSLEDEAFTDTDISDPLLDDIYKRYKIARTYYEDTREADFLEADRLAKTYKMKGRVMIGQRMVYNRQMVKNYVLKLLANETTQKTYKR
jgi:hypothetical protein